MNENHEEEAQHMLTPLDVATELEKAFQHKQLISTNFTYSYVTGGNRMDDSRTWD